MKPTCSYVDDEDGACTTPAWRELTPETGDVKYSCQPHFGLLVAVGDTVYDLDPVETPDPSPLLGKP